VLRTAPRADVATIVITLVPTWASAGAVRRRELLPPAAFVIVGGVKIAVTPVGKPVADRVNGPENPPVTEVWSATRTLPFRTRDADVELVVTAKPPTTTVTITVGAGETPPPVPMMVIG